MTLTDHIVVFSTNPLCAHPKTLQTVGPNVVQMWLKVAQPIVEALHWCDKYLLDPRNIRDVFKSMSRYDEKEVHSQRNVTPSLHKNMLEVL